MHRFSGAALAALYAGLLASPAAGQSLEVTERQAVERALARAAVVEVEEGRVGAARAAADEAGLWPNPELMVERERLGSGGARSSETAIKVEQAIDIAGRRGLRREAMLLRLDATRLEQADRRLAIAHEVRRGHAEALHAAELQALLGRWIGRLEGALRIISRQLEAGEASGYERRRVDRELQTARARQQASDADAVRAREALAGLLEAAGQWRAAGSLIPSPEPPLERYLEALQARVDLAALGARAQASEREIEAARRAWIPDLGVGLGAKRVDESGRRDSGMVLSLSVPLPLFNRGDAAAAQARSTLQALRGERSLKLAEAQGRVRGSWQQSRSLRETAERFQRESLEGSRELSRIAETAWRGGEASLLELLDAYRSELDAETTGLDLALRARTARIEADHISGIE